MVGDIRATPGLRASAFELSSAHGISLWSGRMSLEPCPPSPNCVCSQEDPSDSQHYMEPIDYAGPADAALDAIAAVIESSSGASVSARTGNRVDAIFVSRIFRFKDDVSFVVDPDEGKIHFRSASRVGHSDLGANRKRLNQLIPAIKAKLG